MNTTKKPIVSYNSKDVWKDLCEILKETSPVFAGIPESFGVNGILYANLNLNLEYCELNCTFKDGPVTLKASGFAFSNKVYRELSHKFWLDTPLPLNVKSCNIFLSPNKDMLVKYEDYGFLLDSEYEE